MKRNIIVVSCIWVVLVGSSLAFNYYHAKTEQLTIALQTARSFFDQVLLTRAWNARHGGVYVPVTSKTLPNPYLKDKLRDIRISESLLLTKINPAYMTREIAEIASDKGGVQFHITSRKPLRPQNQPTPREDRALYAFEQGLPEVSEFIENGSSKQFFYMAPLKVEESCLSCHAEQGYVTGDVRGGISVTLPYIPELPIMALIAGHGIIGLVGLFGIIVFGTKLRDAYAEIRHQASIDALTGIPNRRGFSERILSEFSRSNRENYPLSVIMGDIDNFKDYNDKYGHNGGDDCLKTVARAINDTLNRPGDFCARYGGEEFIIILPDTNLGGAKIVAENIRANVGQLRIHEQTSTENEISISLGVATRKDVTLTSYEDLLQQADRALYRAKNNGKNRVEIEDNG